MPSRALRDGLSTVYLDQSTFSYAFRPPASLPQTQAQNLKRWIERVATEANRCVSRVHVFEMASWNEGVGLARWLDTLDSVWMRPLEDMIAAEEEHLVRLVAGSTHARVPSPFAPSLLASLPRDTPPELLRAIGTTPSIEEFALAISGRKRGEERSLMIDFVGDARDDRLHRAALGVSDEALFARLDRLHKSDLRSRAGAAHRRLEQAGDQPYLATGATWGSVQDPFVERFMVDTDVLRTLRVLNACVSCFARETENVDPNSNRTQRRFASSTFDVAHAATGAGYCDVFVCDRFTAACLGEVRFLCGLDPAIVFQGEDIAQFVARLIGAWP